MGRQKRAYQSVTIRDVAERAGVAVSTVSRVLNGLDRVSEETRRRVEQAARSRRTGGLFPSVFRGFRRGAYRLPFPLFRGFLLPGALPAQFRPPFRGKRHHHLVKAVDRRVVLPVQGGIQVFGITLRWRRFRHFVLLFLRRGGRSE